MKFFADMACVEYSGLIAWLDEEYGLELLEVIAVLVAMFAIVSFVVVLKNKNKIATFLNIAIFVALAVVLVIICRIKEGIL